MRYPASLLRVVYGTLDKLASTIEDVSADYGPIDNFLSHGPILSEISKNLTSSLVQVKDIPPAGAGLTDGAFKTRGGATLTPGYWAEPHRGCW